MQPQLRPQDPVPSCSKSRLARGSRDQSPVRRVRVWLHSWRDFCRSRCRSPGASPSPCHSAGAGSQREGGLGGRERVGRTPSLHLGGLRGGASSSHRPWWGPGGGAALLGPSRCSWTRQWSLAPAPSHGNFSTRSPGQRTIAPSLSTIPDLEQGGVRLSVPLPYSPTPATPPGRRSAEPERAPARRSRAAPAAQTRGARRAPRSRARWAAQRA